MVLSASGVRSHGQVVQELEELHRLASKESIVGERCDRTHGGSHGFGRPNDGDHRERPL
jgi:hypothetical protein